MKTVIAVSFVCLAACILAAAQTLQSAHVDIAGNSIAQMQGGFQQLEFPLLPPQNVTINGWYGYTCARLFPLLLYTVPANAGIVVLYNSTNDVRTGVSVSDHIACMQQTVSALVQRNPKIAVLLANTPPFTQANCYGDFRNAIDAYNAAYATTVWPSNVQVVDVWTPNADPTTRWAIPQDMTGACGIHPGPANQWTWSWQHFTAPATQAVTTLILQGHE